MAKIVWTAEGIILTKDN